MSFNANLIHVHVHVGGPVVFYDDKVICVWREMRCRQYYASSRHASMNDTIIFMHAVYCYSNVRFVNLGMGYVPRWQPIACSTTRIYVEFKSRLTQPILGWVTRRGRTWVPSLVLSSYCDKPSSDQTIKAGTL